MAVQLDLETDGLTCQKWGGAQTCKADDWMVNNDGNVYTVDRDTFARTYGAVSPGIYEKDAQSGQGSPSSRSDCHEGRRDPLPGGRLPRLQRPGR